MHKMLKGTWMNSVFNLNILVTSLAGSKLKYRTKEQIGNLVKIIVKIKWFEHTRLRISNSKIHDNRKLS